MDPRTFARLFGTLMLLAGVMALAPSLSTNDDLADLKLPISYGNFLGWFPMNIVNKCVLILAGMAGIAAANLGRDTLAHSISYARLLSVATAVMAVLGARPETYTFFGYWPLYGNANVAAAGLFAITSGAVGFNTTSRVFPEPAAPDLPDTLVPR